MSGKHTLGWIGMGRMGYPMAERLLKAGNTVSIWNRTRAKAEPLAKLGGRVVETPADLAGSDIVFIMVSTGKDLEQVCFGKGGVAAGGKGKAPKVIVDCSSISVQESADCRAKLAGARRRFPRRAGERQRQGGEGRQAERRRVGPQERFRDGQALHAELRAARRVLRRRGRAVAHLQDRAQRDAGRGDPEPRRDHHPGREGRRAAPRLPGVHQQRRHGLHVHALQVQRASSISTGPRRSRPSCCARTSTSGWRPPASWTCRCR